jgi:uncharacterized protein YndB with AHSA1/START domain
MSKATTNGKLSYSYELYFAAPAAKVWEGLFRRDVPLPFMYGTRLSSTLRKDSPYAYVGDHEFKVVDGKILDIEPGARIVMTWAAHWGEAENKDRPSRVSIELTPVDKGTTKLTLVHDEFDGETATYVGSTASWPMMLSSLKSLLETGAPIPVA